MELDAEVIAQLEEVGGRELVEQLLELYLEHAPARLQEIRRSIGAGDSGQAAKAFHSLRSSSATIGAVSLAGEIGELEETAMAGGIEEVTDRWPEVEREAERLLEMLGLQRKTGEGKERP